MASDGIQPNFPQKDEATRTLGIMPHKQGLKYLYPFSEIRLWTDSLRNWFFFVLMVQRTFDALQKDRGSYLIILWWPGVDRQGPLVTRNR